MSSERQFCFYFVIWPKTNKTSSRYCICILLVFRSVFRSFSFNCAGHNEADFIWTIEGKKQCIRATEWPYNIITDENSDWSLNSLVPLRTFVNRLVWRGQGLTTLLSLFVTQPFTVCYRQWVRDEKRLVWSGYPGPRGCEDMMSPRGRLNAQWETKPCLLWDYSQDKALSGRADIVSNVRGRKKKPLERKTKRTSQEDDFGTNRFIFCCGKHWQRKVFLRLRDLVTMLPFSPFNTLMYRVVS